MGPGQATFIIPAMYVLHTVLTIVSGELFYQTYLPMVSPIGREAVRSLLPFPLPCGRHVSVLSCGSQSTIWSNGFKLCRALLSVRLDLDEMEEACLMVRACVRRIRRALGAACCCRCWVSTFSPPSPPAPQTTTAPATPRTTTQVSSRARHAC